MLQIKKNKATRRYERIAAAIGAVLVIVVGFNTVRAESAQTREQLGNTIDYVKGSARPIHATMLHLLPKV